MTRERSTDEVAPELPSSADARRRGRQWPVAEGGGRPGATTTERHRPPAQAAVSGRRAARVPFAVLLLGLLVGGLSLLLLLNTASAADELSRHDLAGQDSSVAAQVQQLQNEVAASAAPANLAKAAESLGMVPAGNPAFLVVGVDGKVTVRGSAAPASQIPVAVPGKVRTTAKPKPTAKTTAKPTAKPKSAQSTAKPKATPKSAKSTAKPKTVKSTATPKSATPKTTPRPGATASRTVGSNR